MSNENIDAVPKDGDWYAKLYDVTDAITGLPITDAIVTVNLLALGGQAVSGAQNISATYDSATAAYWAIIPRTAGVAIGQKYRVQAIAAKGGLQVPFYQEVLVERFPA